MGANSEHTCHLSRTADVSRSSLRSQIAGDDWDSRKTKSSYLVVMNTGNNARGTLFVD